jgi:hypothetical protein
VSRNITEDGSLGKVTNEEPGDHGRAFRGNGDASELDALFGQVGSKPANAELGALDEEPPWQSVCANDVAGLMVAYREARTLANNLRQLLAQVGVSEEELPGLCARVDAQGRAVIVLGTVSMRTAERLRTILRQNGGRPDPPTRPGTSRAA